MIAPARTPLPTSEGQPSPQAEERSRIHLPTVHAQADMRALSNAIKEMTIQKLTGLRAQLAGMGERPGQ